MIKKAFLLSLFLFGLTTSIQAALEQELAAMQGSWKGQVDNEGTPIVVLLEIKEKKFTYVLKSSDGTVFAKLRGDFKLDKFGPLKAMTISNVEIMEGDNAGQKLLGEGETRASVFKISGNTFFLGNGFSDSDNDDPSFVKLQKQ